MRINLLIWTLTLSLFSCATGPENEHTKEELSPLNDPPFELKYATGFEADFYEEGILISINRAWKDMQEPMLFWIPGKEGYAQFEGAQSIPSEIKRIACLSTSHLHAFELLESGQMIKGVANPNHVYSEFYQNGLKNGTIIRIGSNQEIDYENLLTLDPDILLIYGIGDAVIPQLEKLESLEIPYLLIGEYMEEHPLGQAEWLKLFGVLIGKEEMADSVFSKLESEYLAIQKMQSESSEKPTVFLNSPWEGVWYMPASANFSTHLIEDAGGQLLFKNDEEEGWQTLDKEFVFEKAYDADFWLNTGSHNSLRELEAFFPMASDFQAFQNAKVYNNVKRISEGGGNDYWESGIYRPDLVLKDLYLILHADSLNSADLFYFKHL